MSAGKVALQQRPLAWMGNWSKWALLDATGWNRDLASTGKEYDHDAAGQRQVAVTDGSLGDFWAFPFIPCSAGGTTATGQLVIGWVLHVRYRTEAVEAWLQQQADKRSQSALSPCRSYLGTE
jgi:hypothetical protein